MCWGRISQVVTKLILQCQGIKKPKFASNVDDLLADRVSGEVIGKEQSGFLFILTKQNGGAALRSLFPGIRKESISSDPATTHY